MYEFKRDQLHLSPSSRVVIHKGPFYDYKILQTANGRALSETTASESRGEADAAFLFLSSFSALLQSHGSRCCCPSLCPSKYIICDSRAIRCKFVGRVNAHFSRRCLDLAI